MPKLCHYCGNTANSDNYTTTPSDQLPKKICNDCYNIRCYHCLELKEILTTVKIKNIPGMIIAKDKEELQLKEMQYQKQRQIGQQTSKYIIVPEYSKICIQCLYKNIYSVTGYTNHSNYLTYFYPHNNHDLGRINKLMEFIYDDYYTFKQSTTKHIEQLESTIITTQSNTLDQHIQPYGPELPQTQTTSYNIDDKLKHKLDILLKNDNTLIDIINEKYNNYSESIKTKISNLQQAKANILAAKECCDNSDANKYLLQSIENIDNDIKGLESLLKHN